MESENKCKYCKSAEHKIENCNKIVCYICKKNHHFTVHNSSWYQPKMWNEFQTGLKIHKDYLDTQWKQTRNLYEKESIDMGYVDYVIGLARKDNQKSVEKSMMQYRDIRMGKLRNITVRLTELTRDRDNFYKQLKQFENYIEILRSPGKVKENEIVCSICREMVPNRVLLCCGNVLCENCEKKQLEQRNIKQRYDEEYEFEVTINTDCPFCKGTIRTAKMII